MTHPKGASARARPRPREARPACNTGRTWFTAGNPGKQTTYRPEAATIAEQGATLAELAATLGCTDRTLRRWRLQHAEFREALDRGRKRRAVEQAAAAKAPEIEAQRQTRKAALALKEMLKHLLPTPAEASAEPTSAHQPLPSARYAHDAHDEAARRRAERRAARGQMPEPEEPQEWPGAINGEPIPLDDPLADW
jgi:transposase-like protein